MERVVIRWPVFILACLLILALAGCVFWNNHQALEAADAQQASLQLALTRLQNDQLSLSNQLTQIGTPSYVEAVARAELSFLKPGELRFEIVNPQCLEGYTEAEMKILNQEMIIY